MPLDPYDYADSSSLEHGQQVALMMWAALPMTREVLPDLRWMHAIPNGGERSKSQASRLKAEGVKKGFPDIGLPVRRKGYAGLYIEMKREKGVPSDVSKEQHEWHQHLRSQGYLVQVCYGFRMARLLLCDYFDVDPREVP